MQAEPDADTHRHARGLQPCRIKQPNDSCHMAVAFVTGTVLQSLADHVREYKSQAFDFGPCNHVRYDQVP